MVLENVLNDVLDDNVEHGGGRTELEPRRVKWANRRPYSEPYRLGANS